MICVDSPSGAVVPGSNNGEHLSILWIPAVIRDTISNSGTIEYSAAAEEGGEISGEREH